MAGKKNKRIFWIGGIIIVLLVIVSVVKSSGGTELKVTTDQAALRTIVETVVANGRIQPETEVIISSEVSGKILELPLKEGDQVKTGDLLVKINPDLALAALDRARAALNTARANEAGSKARLTQAEAQFSNAELSFSRSQSLFDQGAISRAEFEDAQASHLTAEAEVEAARQSVLAAEFNVQSALAGVKEAEDSYSRTTITSPMDGTISRLDVEVGEQVVGAMQMTGTEIMRVANLEIMEVVVDVNESDIVRVNFGDTAKIEVDAYLDREFLGVVTEIANSAKAATASLDQVTNFEVKVRILQSSYTDLIKPDSPGLSPFRPGMNATVEIQTATKRNVVAIPIECITMRSDTTSSDKPSAADVFLTKKSDEDGESFTVVFVPSPTNRAQIRVVETGIQDDRYIEIVSGLNEGDKVISGPYDAVSQKLYPGAEIDEVSKDNLYSGNRK